MKGKISKEKITLIVAIGLSAIVLAVGLITFIPQVVKNNVRQKILETGVEGIGYNVEINEKSLVNKNDQIYCSVVFKYVDANGREQTAETAVTFTQVEAYNVVMKKKMKIKYNEKGAIDVNFDKELAISQQKMEFLITLGISVFIAGIGASRYFKKRETKKTTNS